MQVSVGPANLRFQTDIPGYWCAFSLQYLRYSLISVWCRDAIIDSPPDAGTINTKRRRDFHQPLEYEKRWFGPFDSWLKKLTTVRSSDTVSRNYHVRGDCHSVL